MVQEAGLHDLLHVVVLPIIVEFSESDTCPPRLSRTMRPDIVTATLRVQAGSVEAEREDTA